MVVKVRARALWGLLFCAIIILACRLYTLSEPLQNDLTLYALISHEMLSGKTLYQDLFDHKPPGIFVTFALCELVAGFGPAALFLASLLPSLLTLLALFWAASQLFRDDKERRWWAAIACSFIWSLVSGDLLLEANQANTELFQSCFKSLGFAFILFAAPATGRSAFKNVIVAAIFFALASFYKQTAALTAAFIAVAHVLCSKERPFKHFVTIALVGLLFWFLVFGYFAVVGRFDAFWQANVTYNSQYAGASGWSLPQKILATLNINHLLPLKVGAPLFLFTLASFLYGMAKWRRENLLLLAWLFATVIEIALAGRYYSHYYQLFLPPLVLGSVWGLCAICEKFSRRHALFGFLVLLLAVCAVELPYYSLSTKEWSLKKYPWLDFPQMQKLGYELPLLLQKDESFYQWGESTGLYFYAKQRPPSGVIYSFHAQYGPLRDELSHRLLKDLQASPPELVLVDRRRAFFGPVPNWIMENYVPLPKLKQRWKLIFFGRKGGRLASLYGPPKGLEPLWQPLKEKTKWTFTERTFVYAISLRYSLPESSLAPKCKFTWSNGGKQKEQGAVLEAGVAEKSYLFWIWDELSELNFSLEKEGPKLKIHKVRALTFPRGNPVPH